MTKNILKKLYIFMFLCIFLTKNNTMLAMEIIPFERLVYYISIGDDDAILYYFSHGGDMNAKDKNGSLLDYAIERAFIDQDDKILAVIELLLDCGAKINMNNWYVQQCVYEHNGKAQSINEPAIRKLLKRAIKKRKMIIEKQKMD